MRSRLAEAVHVALTLGMARRWDGPGVGALLLAGAACIAPAAHAQSTADFTVGDIKIEGLQRISEGTVYNYLPINVGDQVTSRKLDEALRALEQTIRQRFGTTARYSISADRVSITLTAAAPDTLAQWLTQARVNARALPAEARLTRNAAGQWDGTLVMTLPARQGQ